MRFSGICWLVCAALLFQAHGGRATEQEETPRDEVVLASLSEELWWLPEDTELIAVSQKNEKETATKTGIAGVSLGGIRQDKFAQLLAKIPMSRIVEGSRKFREPQEFGLMPYEGCSIIDFQSDLPKDHALLKWLAKNSNRIAIVAGYKTYIIDEKVEQDQWHFFITQPAPNILLCATNRNYLESVLRRRLRSAREREKTKRALPDDLAEWKYIDTDSPEWALRHYRKDQARFDPSSPFIKGGFIADTDAIGLTYSQDGKDSTAVLHHLTAPRSAAQVAKIYQEFWRGLLQGGVSSSAGKWRPMITAQAGGTIDMKFAFSKPNPKDARDTVGMFIFGLFALMGHAIVV